MNEEFAPNSPLYLVQVIDAQGAALERIGRSLTAEELYRVKKGLEAGLNDCWYDFMKIAIDLAVEDPDIDHSNPLPSDYWPLNCREPLA